MLVKTQKNISVSQLKPAPHNPALRIGKDRLGGLMRSLQQEGQLVPILVTQNNMIVDGHRRWAAAKMMGLPTLLAIVIEGDADRIYAAVNSTSLRLNGNDKLGVWLKNPKAVSPFLHKHYEQLEKLLGKKELEQLYLAGLSYGTYLLAVRVAREGSSYKEDTIRKLIHWFIKYRATSIARKALDVGQADLILKAVIANKPLILKLQVEDNGKS